VNHTFNIALATWLLLTSTGGARPSGDSNSPAPRYKVIELPLRALGVNDEGQVAGTTVTDKDQVHAALWSQKTGLRDLGVPPGFYSSGANGINNQGHAVGNAATPDDSSTLAFIYKKGRLVVLGPSKSPAISRANAINNLDQIAGESVIRGKAGSRAVVWAGKKLLDVGGCCGGIANAINDQGQAVGYLFDAEGHYHAFLWDGNHGRRQLGPKEGFSNAVAINNRGHVVIKLNVEDILLYAEGKTTVLKLSPHNNTAHGINDADVVVGASGPTPDKNRAFVWDKQHGFRDLNKWIPADSGWLLQTASDINNRGQIVGWGEYRGKDNVGFLLTPQ